MNNQIDSTTETNLNDAILRDLLDNEIMFIGGGEASTTTY